MKPLEGHTLAAYDGELSQLHLLLVEMGGLVIFQLDCALKSLKCSDVKLARQVIERDDSVDKLELKVDAEIESILARRTPVARDLRTVLTCSKSVAALEQIGDEAGKIAQVTLQINSQDSRGIKQSLTHDLARLGDNTLKSLTTVIEALDIIDPHKAAALIKANKAQDVQFQQSVRRTATFMLDDSRNMGPSIQILLAGNALERISTLSKNIAEHIVYLVDGDDIRHGRQSHINA